MNINELTIGQVKELSSLLNTNTTKQSNLYDRYINKYVICRSRNEGVNAGKVIAADDTGVILEDARRLHWHHPADKKISWYKGVASTGLGEDSRVGVPIEKIIVEDYSLTICTQEAEDSIRGADSHEQD